MSENPSSNRETPKYGIEEWGNDRQSLGFWDAKIEEINANIIYQREHRMLCENDLSLGKEFSDSIITKIDLNIKSLNDSLVLAVKDKTEIEKRTAKFKL